MDDERERMTVDREPSEPRMTWERRPWQTPRVIESTIGVHQTATATNINDDGPQSVS
jgi:hypothetical protein